MCRGMAIVIVVVAACGNGKTGAPAAGSAVGSAAGSGSSAVGAAAAAGSGHAAPIAPGICMPGRHKPTQLVADDRTVTVCSMLDPSLEDKTNKQLLFDDEIKKPPPACMALDLASGTWREAKPPPPPAKPAPAAFEARQNARGVQVCKGTTCIQFAALPPNKGRKYLIAVSDDGKRAVVIANVLKGAWLFDATTGEKVKELPLVSAGEPLETGFAAFVGERIYIALRVSFETIAPGTLYTWDGDPIGKIDGGERLASLVPLGGDLYAFSGGYSGLEILDARSGKMREVKVHWTLPLVRTSPGKLVAGNEESLAVIDAAAGKIEQQVRLPVCTEKPVAATPQPQQPSLILLGDHALAGADHALIEFTIGDNAQANPGTAFGYRPGDPAVLAASGETAYATIHLNTACAAETGNETAWSRITSDGQGWTELWGLTLVAADADGVFWATSEAALYKLTKQGRSALRVADFPQNAEVVRLEPTRLLVLDLLGAERQSPHEPWVAARNGAQAEPKAKERRLVAIDKTTGEPTDLLRGNLGFVRAIGDELWIVRDGTDLLAIGRGMDSAVPRGNLPEAATSVEIDGDTVYWTPATGDRVLAMPMTGGAPTVVADGLAGAEILGASADHLVLGAADSRAERVLERRFKAMEAATGPSWFVWAPPKRILSVPKAGGTAKVIASDLQTVRATASDPGHVYVQVAACFNNPANGCPIIDDPAIWVIDKRNNRARRMNGVGSCDSHFVVGERGVWLPTGQRLDQRTAPPVYLSGGVPRAATGTADALFLAVEHRVLRVTSAGYEVIADVLADTLAIGGSYLYFHDAETGRIGRIAIQTGKTETVVASAPSVVAMTADASGVYWWAGPTQSLETASGPGTQRTLLANAPQPDGLAASAGRIALRAGEHLVVMAADGTSQTRTLGSAGTGVAGDDTYVYWTEDDGQEHGATVLVRARWSGGDRQVVGRVAR